MLMLLEKYNKEYPHRPLSTLEKFIDEPEYLHEMSAETLQAIIGKWKPMQQNTADKVKREILAYLKWLQTQGFKVNISTVQSVAFPIAKVQHYIYSTKDLADYYEKLYAFMEKQCVLNSTVFGKSKFYMCHAAGILAFYGLTDEQIIALDLSDVQPDGVRGYDLPLTKEDIDVLLAYKDTTRMTNNMPLVGTKYIRSTRIGDKGIDGAFLSRPIWRVKFDAENEYLKNLLRVSNLYKMGIFNRLYECEKSNEELLKLRYKNYDWYKEITGIDSRSTMLIRKKEYIAYREERELNCPWQPQPEKTTQIDEQNQEVMAKRLSELQEQMAKLNAEMQQLQGLIKK